MAKNYRPAYKDFSTTHGNVMQTVIYAADLGRKVKRKKINTRRRHKCEIGFIFNPGKCIQRAYRKVSSRFGYKYVCDCCARALCEESEGNRINRPEKYVPNAGINKQVQKIGTVAQ